MANQDILFPYLPRNTQVDITDKNLRVKRVAKKPASGVVEDGEAFDPTQDARVHEFMHGNQPTPNAAQTLDHADGTPIAEDPVATDPRRKHHGHDDDDHKGTQLDTFV